MSFPTSILTALRRSETWLGAPVYLLVIFSAFSRTGVELSIIMLVLAAAYRWVRFPPGGAPPLWIVSPFLLWFGVALLSTLVNPNFWGNLTSLPDLFRFLLPFAILPALFAVDVRRLLLAYLAFISLMALYGVVQYYTGINWLRPGGAPLLPMETVAKGGEFVYRAKGVYRNPIIYSSVMLMTAPLFLSLFFSERGSGRYIWLFGALMGVVAVTVSVTRSAGLGLFVGLLVLALRLRPRVSIPLIAVALAVFAAFAGLILSGSLKPDRHGRERSPTLYRLVNTTVETSRERLYRWEAGWMAIKENPWLGVGPDKTLKSQVIHYMIKVSRKHRIRVPRGQRVKGSPRYRSYRYRLLPTGLIHNVHLQVAFHYGWLGFLAALSIWVTTFVWCGLWIRRAGKDFSFETGLLWGAAGGLAGSIVDGFFNNNFLDGMNQAVIMMFIGFAFYAGLRIRDSLAEQQAAARRA